MSPQALRRVNEDRALILAPIGRDAAVATGILAEAGFDPAICPSLPVLVAECGHPSGFIVLTEEVLSTGDVHGLSRCLADQPPWSDLPIILLMRKVAGLERNPSAQRFMNLLGNVSFIERPFHPTTLVSAARAALRARRRQYEARAFFEDQLAAAERLKDSEEGRRLAIEAAQIGTWHYFPATGRLDWDARTKQLFGLSRDADVSIATVIAALHPEDSMAARAAVEAALDPHATGAFAIEYRVIGIEDGVERWLAANGRAHFDGGRPIRFAGTVRDVTLRRRAEEQRRLLVNELNHRVKNTLATIQSIARQTLAGNGDADCRRDFEGRLLALSQAHNVLTREHWGSAGLHDLVLNTFAPYGTPADGAYRVQGPNVSVSPRTALALALALHELATNAAKYGALSVPEGRVGVRWSLVPGASPPRLRLDWAEVGGPRVLRPTRKGFGSKLIERGLAMEIDGKVRLDFNPGGVRCRIEVPLTGRGETDD